MLYYIPVCLLVGMLHLFIRSRGHNPIRPVVGILVSTALVVIAFSTIPGIWTGIYFLPFVLCGIGFLAYSVIPATADAPGKALFHIEFTCPECGASAKADRYKEGTAMICSGCEEIITVPRDHLSDPAPAFIVPKRPPQAKGPVRIRTYQNVPAAEIDRMTLEEAGLAVSVQHDSSGFNVASPVRLLVDADDWTEARRLLLEAHERASE